MKFYAIRHKPTGFLMPNANGSRGSGSGFTWIEPDEWGTPRLFTTVGDASRAATWWAKGQAYVVGENQGVTCQKVNGRDRKDLEIVSVILDIESIT